MAHETGVANVADPLGGSGYVEWMTDEMERQAEEVFAHLLELGGGSILEGATRASTTASSSGEIADAAYRFEREVNAGRRIIVGVNAFTDGNEDRADDTLRIDPAVEEHQLRRLANVGRSATRRRRGRPRRPVGVRHRPDAEPDAAAHRGRAGPRDRGRDRRAPWRPCSAPTSRGSWCDRATRRPGRARQARPRRARPGLKVVARILRDAGMEVVYLGLRQTPEGVASVVEQEDADVVGISMHNASHLTLGPLMVTAPADLGLATPVVIGGIIPDRDAVRSARRAWRRCSAPAPRPPRSSRPCGSLPPTGRAAADESGPARGL